MSNAVKLDENLNLVFPAARGWIHATPISYETFSTHFLALSQTFSMLYEQVGEMAAPRVAFLTLKKLAQGNGTWDGQQGVENSLINEIIRLSNYVFPGDDCTGWQTWPLYEALRQPEKSGFTLKVKEEVLNALTFFIVDSCLVPEVKLRSALNPLLMLLNGQITALNVTAFKESLKTLTKDGSTETKEPALSTTALAGSSVKDSNSSSAKASTT